MIIISSSEHQHHLHLLSSCQLHANKNDWRKSSAHFFLFVHCLCVFFKIVCVVLCVPLWCAAAPRRNCTILLHLRICVSCCVFFCLCAENAKVFFGLSFESVLCSYVVLTVIWRSYIRRRCGSPCVFLCAPLWRGAVHAPFTCRTVYIFHLINTRTRLGRGVYNHKKTKNAPSEKSLT